MKTSALLLCAGFLFCCLPATFSQDVTTSGDQSPAVVAKHFSATYGVRADAIEAILTLYETEGLSPGQRKSRTEILLKKYQQAPEKKKGSPMLSDDTKTQLGLNAAEAEALDWDLFARKYYIGTTGYQSPGVYAPGGEVNIWYGVPPKVVRALAGVLEQNKVDVGELEKRLGEQVKKYEELKAEFEAYGPSDTIVKQAEQLLEEGKLLEVERLLDSDYAASKKRQAYKGFLYGQTKELLLKYDAAAVGYWDAVMLDSDNSKYLQAYAYNEYTRAQYDEAIKYYEKALAVDTVVFKNQPEKASRLYNNLGTVWQTKGQYDRAIIFFEKAIAIDSVVFGGRHPNVAVIFNNLGSAWQAKGEYDHAITFYEKALPILVQALGEKHPNVAIQFSNLGYAWKYKGEYDLSIIFFEKALRIDSSIFGNHHSTVSIDYNRLGSAWQAKGDYNRAISFYEKSLPILTGIFGENHPIVAIQYNHLGSAWQQKHKYDLAINFFEKALAIDSLTFGINHPHVAIGFNNLGSAWQDKGKYDRAIEFYEKALNILVKISMGNHPDAASCYKNLGTAWEMKREYDRAIEFYEKAIYIDSMTLGAGHPDIAIGLNNLGSVWQEKGDYDLAIEFYEKALDIFLVKLGEKHPNVSTQYNNLGTAYRQKGEYEQTISFFEKAAVIDSAAFENTPIDLARDFNNLGTTYHQKGEHDRAITFFEKSQAILILFLDPQHHYYKTNSRNLSRAANDRGLQLFREKKHAEALPYFQKALENAEAAQDWSFSLTCLNNIGSMHKHLGQYTEGLAALEKGIARIEKINLDIDEEIKILTPDQLQQPEIQTQIATLKNLPLHRRLRYHQAGCLAGLGRKKETDALYQQLLQEARETNDTRLLEDLKKDGVH